MRRFSKFPASLRAFSLAALAAVLSNCAPMPRQVSASMKAYARHYDLVSVNMTKSEVSKLMGAPQKRDGQKLIWELRYDDGNSDSLHVQFQKSGEIRHIDRYSKRKRTCLALSLHRSYLTKFESQN